MVGHRHFDRGDQFAGREVRFPLWRKAGGPVQIGEGQAEILAIQNLHFDLIINGQERYGKIAALGRDASRTRAKNSQPARIATDCAAAGAGRTLVAGRGEVAEVAAPSALQQVAPNGRHITDLWAG